MQDTNHIMSSERICVIIPTYNNGGTLADVLRRVRRFTDNLIVVNDGSSDATREILQQERTDAWRVIDCRDNRGKGYALRRGMKEAIRCGYRYAVTMDSDGQHFPEDLPRLIECFQAHRGSLIVGTRNLTEKNMPRGNTFANRFSNFWFYVQTGIRLNDTQSGYRLYPLQTIRPTWFLTARYEAELECLVMTAWHFIPIVSQPVHVYYPPEAERVSHFRPFADFARISVLNTLLCFGAAFYYLPRCIIRRIMKRDE